jgi:hypothetical protein
LAHKTGTGAGKVEGVKPALSLRFKQEEFCDGLLLHRKTLELVEKVLVSPVGTTLPFSTKPEAK